MMKDMRQPSYRERAAGRGPLAGSMLWQAVGVAGTTRRILPDGCMDLIWTGRELLVAGPDTVAQMFSDDTGATYTGLRFAPGTAPALLGVRADELRDQRMLIGDIWPAAEARRLTEALAWSPSPGRTLEAYAAAAPRHTVLAEPLAAAIANRLTPRTDGGAVSVRAAATAVGLSERQLNRRCHAAFGYGPKTLARILRFRRALELAQQGVPLADAALDTGYADQSHLCRDVRALTGLPPLDLLGRRDGSA